jgi:hypothetical protein
VPSFSFGRADAKVNTRSNKEFSNRGGKVHFNDRA